MNLTPRLILRPHISLVQSIYKNLILRIELFASTI